MGNNRSKRAREQAGLSPTQAARWLGVSRDTLAMIEESDDAYRVADKAKMAEIYGVSVAWMDGTGPDRDYATIDKMRGAEDLSFHDRDILAEFAASLPRRTK